MNKSYFIWKSYWKIFFQKEYITFNQDLTKSTEPLLSGDWKDSKLLLPFDGFTKDKHPEVIFHFHCLRYERFFLFYGKI